VVHPIFRHGAPELIPSFEDGVNVKPNGICIGFGTGHRRLALAGRDRDRRRRMTEEELMRTRSRRAFALSATGLFLPAAPAVLAADPAADPETERRRGRRRKHRKSKDRPKVWANDTIIKLLNASSKPLWYCYQSEFTSSWQFRLVEPGKETGWMEHVPPWKLTTNAYLHISERENIGKFYRFSCKNYEIGTPTVKIEWGSIHSLTNNFLPYEEIDKFKLREGEDATPMYGYFNVFRWSNGTEYIDDHSEEYTRFFVTVNRVWF
jgi:hypothetical protein